MVMNQNRVQRESSPDSSEDDEKTRRIDKKRVPYINPLELDPDVVHEAMRAWVKHAKRYAERTDLSEKTKLDFLVRHISGPLRRCIKHMEEIVDTKSLFGFLEVAYILTEDDDTIRHMIANLKRTGKVADYFTQFMLLHSTTPDHLLLELHQHFMQGLNDITLLSCLGPFIGNIDLFGTRDYAEWVIKACHKGVNIAEWDRTHYNKSRANRKRGKYGSNKYQGYGGKKLLKQRSNFKKKGGTLSNRGSAQFKK